MATDDEGSFTIEGRRRVQAVLAKITELKPLDPSDAFCDGRPNINYQGLLAKYMRIVHESEGVTYVDSIHHVGGGALFTAYELAALTTIDDEIRKGPFVSASVPCRSLGCEGRNAAGEALLDDIDPPEWHPYCDECLTIFETEPDPYQTRRNPK